MTQLEICNAALDAIGDGDPPVTVLSGTKRANVLARQWPFALAELLRAHPWNWAKTRAELTAEVDPPAFGWGYNFELPANFVSLCALNDDEAGRGSDTYEIESGFLLTNAAEANVEYIYTPGSSELAAFVARMDPSAVQALVYLLASKIATTLAKDGASLSSHLLELYRREISAAQTRNYAEQKAARQWEHNDSRSIASRFGTTGIAGASASAVKIGRLRLPTYTVAGVEALTLAVAGDVVFATDGRKAAEGAGDGTGVVTFYDGTNWIACDTGATLEA